MGVLRHAEICWEVKSIIKRSILVLHKFSKVNLDINFEMPGSIDTCDRISLRILYV